MLAAGARSPASKLEAEQEWRLASSSPAQIAETFQTKEGRRAALLQLSRKDHIHAILSKDHTIWRNFARYTYP